MDENGERKRATISEHVNIIYQDLVSREDQCRLNLKIDGDQLDDLNSYNQLMEYLEDNTDTGKPENGLYKFRCVKDQEAHARLQTLSTLEVAITYLVNGKMGR